MRRVAAGLRRLSGALRGSSRALAVALRVRCLQRARAPLRGDGPVVLTVVRNGAEYVPAFLAHYRRLGAARIVILDNGSTDATTELARGHGDVTVLRCVLPFNRFEHALRYHLLSRYGRNRWSLLVDVDEHFDYPYSDSVPIGALLTYLDARGYDAVVAYLLDMFSGAPLGAGAGEDFVTTHRCYDVAGVTEVDYPANLGNVTDEPAVRARVGGIRKTVFGLDRLDLTKHPLRHGVASWLDNQHYVRNARIADFTGVLYHYKFAGAFAARVRERVEAGSHRHDAAGDEHARYLTTLATHPALELGQPTSRYLETPRQLLEEGIFVASASFRAWAEAQAASRGGR